MYIEEKLSRLILSDEELERSYQAQALYWDTRELMIRLREFEIDLSVEMDKVPSNNESIISREDLAVLERDAKKYTELATVVGVIWARLASIHMHPHEAAALIDLFEQAEKVIGDV